MYIRSLIYVFGSLFLAFSSLSARDQAPLAVAGVLDLREYNFKADGPVNLDGEFEFYCMNPFNIHVLQCQARAPG